MHMSHAPPAVIRNLRLYFKLTAEQLQHAQQGAARGGTGPPHARARAADPSPTVTAGRWAVRPAGGLSPRAEHLTPPAGRRSPKTAGGPAPVRFDSVTGCWSGAGPGRYRRRSHTYMASGCYTGVKVTVDAVSARHGRAVR